MAFVGSMAAARAFTAKGEPDVDADLELRALGLANVAGGGSQAFPAGGGPSQTAINRGAGARTHVAAVVTALVVVLTLLFLTALFDAATPRPDVLVVDFSAVPDIDITALDELPAFVANGRERGITLWLANINARPLDMIRRLPDADRWESQLFRGVNDDAEAYTARTRPEVVSEESHPRRVMSASATRPNHGDTGTAADRQGWRMEAVDYEIRIKGRVSDSQLLAFEGMTVTVEPVETVAYGPLPDQEAVHQLMAKLQALGLEIVELRRLPGHPGDEGASGEE